MPGKSATKHQAAREMRSSWLIQRLEKPHGPMLGGLVVDNPFSFGGGLKNGGLSAEAMDLIRGVFSFDYMGAAEFEWGAVPEAMQHVAKCHEDYIAFTITVALADVPPNWRDKSGVTPDGDATIYVIAAKDSVREVGNRIREWATKSTARLKEQTHLPDALRPYGDYPTRVCGWLELDNGFFFFTDEEMWQQTASLFAVQGAGGSNGTS